MTSNDNPLLVDRVSIITWPQLIVACIHGLFDHNGSSIDYFIFGSLGHIMLSFMVLLIPAYISVWLGR